MALWTTEDKEKEQVVLAQLGYLKQVPQPDQLDLKTLLCDRYVIGAMLRENGQGKVYQGYDLEEEYAIWIEEFFPEGLVTRAEDQSNAPQRTVPCTQTYPIASRPFHR